MSLKIRKRIKTRVGLFFMSSEIRKRIKTPTGLFFTSLEMRERVEVRGTSFSDSDGSFFHEHGNEKASSVWVDLFFRFLWDFVRKASLLT